MTLIVAFILKISILNFAGGGGGGGHQCFTNTSCVIYANAGFAAIESYGFSVLYNRKVTTLIYLLINLNIIEHFLTLSLSLCV